jgi:GNAT superfamily N-acetyltransferase
MSKEIEVKIRLMTEHDVAAAIRLQKPERWNQTELDWRRLIHLEPLGCFAAWLHERLVGTLTTTTYGTELAWIGMVLVDTEYRRTGIATRLMHAAFDYLLGAGIRAVKLDATPEGHPVYESLGFEDEQLIERWAGIARATTAVDRFVQRASTLPDVFEFDRCAFGADRSKLLQSLVDDAAIAPLIRARPDGRLNGYALARNGREAFYIGPVVAEDAATAGALLNGMFHQLTGRQVYVDLNTNFESGARELAARGLSKQRSLTRMRYGKRSKDCRTSRSIFAIAGPELG